MVKAQMLGDADHRGGDAQAYSSCLRSVEKRQAV